MKRNGRPERSSPVAQQPGVRSWRDIERYMERSRDLRAATLAALLARAFGRARRALSLSRQYRALPNAIILIGFAFVGGLVTSANGVLAQQTQASAPMTETVASDRALLAERGLALDKIEVCDDVESLWRVVRELVLPGRVSESTQQRILRRVWAIDPDTRHSSIFDSQTN